MRKGDEGGDRSVGVGRTRTQVVTPLTRRSIRERLQRAFRPDDADLCVGSVTWAKARIKSDPMTQITLPPTAILNRG